MSSEFQKGLVESYDRLFCRPDFSLDGRPAEGFGNLGYFAPGIDDLNAASEHLMDVLMERIEHRDGLVLDVACGIGGTTRCLTKRFPATAIHGINLSARQLEQCRERVPGAHFHVMAAERMTFPDAMFDTVISVEAAMHFKGRREFLLEAMRVLKPGGEIVVADMPFRAEPTSFTSVLGGQEIYPDIDAYRALWESCGVADVEIEDVTKPVWHDFCAYLQRTALHDRLAGLVDGGAFRNRLDITAKIRALPALAYVIVKGRKPESVT
jgi:MPBQ/MSBQ methyltransferase